MFADPTITINAIAQALKRTGFGTNSGSFVTNDGTHRLTISHSASQGGGFQRMIRLDRIQNVANPLSTGESLEVLDSVWFVSKTPKIGLLTVTQQKQLVDGFIAFLTASSGAAITSLLGGES
nr:MAG: hypothetical protein 2 [Leviviridae sp.]